MRLFVAVGVSIKLCEEIPQTCGLRGKSECLIPIVPAVEISRSKAFGHNDLRDFLAVTENAKLGLAGEYFPPAEQARLAAEADQFVIPKDFCSESLEGQVFLSREIRGECAVHTTNLNRNQVPSAGCGILHPSTYEGGSDAPAGNVVKIFPNDGFLGSECVFLSRSFSTHLTG